MTRRALLHTLSALLAAIVTRPAVVPVREESGDWSREHFNRRRLVKEYRTNTTQMSLEEYDRRYRVTR